MSLINDMLRDLAHRQENNPAEDSQQQLLADSGLARKPKSVWLPSVLVFVFTLVLLLGVQHHLGDKQNPAAMPVVADHDAQTMSPHMTDNLAQSPAVTDVAEITPLAERAVDPDPAESTAASPAVTHGADVATLNMHQQVVDAWLKLADTALIQDRLTSPLEDSAYYFYQQVLTLVPDHPQAQRGMENIVARYLVLAREAAQQQQLDRARILLQRANIVAPDSVAVEELAQQLARGRTESQQEQAASVQLADAPVSYSVPAQPEVAATPVLQVKPSREWQDQQAAGQARELMQQGQVQAARALLENFLQDGEATLASQLLCQIYLEQGDFAAAAKVIANAEAHHWRLSDRVRLQAQWFIAQEDHTSALGLLEKHLVDAQDDERYRALLASVYRATGKYHEAAASYRRLLDAFGESSGYWLGLALSLDALGQKHSALESFQRARNFQPLQAEVNLYIEQRIAALMR